MVKMRHLVTTLSLRHLSVGIWGVIDCPLKFEIKEQCDDQNALVSDDLDNKGGESEQSYKNENQQQYMKMTTLRQAFTMLRTKMTQAWPPTYALRIHGNNDQ